MANIFILMEQNIQASGKMINSMAKEYNNGQMDKNMKGNIEMVLKQEKACLNFLMVVITKDSFLTIKFMGWV